MAGRRGTWAEGQEQVCSEPGRKWLWCSEGPQVGPGEEHACPPPFSCPLILLSLHPALLVLGAGISSSITWWKPMGAAGMALALPPGGSWKTEGVGQASQDRKGQGPHKWHRKGTGLGAGKMELSGNSMPP
jgi:hypothetical protein